MRMLVSLVTLGDPDTMTGGYLYHRRLADMAPEHGAELRFVSFPQRLFPLPALAGRAIARAASEADVIVVDSIATAFWGRPRLRTPVVGMAHQARSDRRSILRANSSRMVPARPGVEATATPGRRDLGHP
jgi:hypothetical protein